MRRSWALGVFSASLLAALANCSSGPSSAEKTGSNASALRSPIYSGGARKVCQLIGNTDFQTGQPTKSQSGTRGVPGTDLGFPILDDSGRLRFFFGDTLSGPEGHDVLGFTDSPFELGSGTAECPTLQFANSDQETTITLDGNVLGDFETPIGGFFTGFAGSPKEKFYMFFNVRNDKGVASSGVIAAGGSFPGGGPYGGRAVLGMSDLATANAFRSVAGAPTDLDHFVEIWPVLVDASAVPSVDQALPGAGPIVLMWGAGHPIRASGVYLAAVRLGQIGDATSWRYQRFDTWTKDPTAATTVYSTEPDPCVGELSVSRNTVLNQWMMVYACLKQPWFPEVNRGIYLRTSDDPLGPWSPPALVFDAGADRGYGHFMHSCNARGVYAGDGTTLVPPLHEPHAAAPQASCPLPANAKCIDTSLPPPAGCDPPKDSDGHAPQGCCTDQNVCCDHTYSPDMGSNVWGGEYAPYPIQLYSKATGFVPRSTTLASGTSLYFMMSTWNPYAVDLMATGVAVDDADGDGVDNDVDNCPAAYNPNQENCNEKSEDSWNERNQGSPVPRVDVLGDACDPVPCPDSNANRTTATTSAPIGGCSPLSGPSLGISCVVREIHDQIDFIPVGASATLVESVNHPTPAATVSNVTTHARFCQQNFARGFDCYAARNVRDSFLDRLYAGPDSEQRMDTAHPWHRIRLSPQVRLIDPRTLQTVQFYDATRARGAPLDPATYGLDTGNLRWEYADDDDYWRNKSPHTVVIPPPEDYAACIQPIFGNGTCLKGRIWLHGDTPVGSDENNQTADGTFVGFHAIELANHYFDIKPDEPVSFLRGGVGVRLSSPFFLARTLPDPPGPEAWNFFAQGEAFPFVTELGSNSIFAVRERGERVDVTASLGLAFAQSLRAASFTWTNAGESSPFAGDLARPMAVALSSDGTQIAMRAASQNGKFVLTQQLDLVARKAYNPDGWTDAAQRFSSAVRFAIPSSIPVFEGSADSQSCSISWRVSADNSVTCTFRGPGQTTGGDTQVVNPDRVTAYHFQSCTNGAKAGDVAEVTGLSLHIDNGDGRFGTTSVRLPLSVWESDAAGFSVPPPVPSATATHPASRRDFASVYSRTANAVFVVGGRTPAGAFLDDIWFQPLGGEWKQVELPHGVLGHPLSATYSWADRRLWVIDEIQRADHKMETRLLRIERETGAFEVVAKARSSGVFEKRGLVVDPQGNVVLYASSTPADRHRLARVTVKPSSFGVAVTDSERRALITAPIVDLHGYRFLFVPHRDDEDDDDRERADRGRHRETPSDGVRLKSLPFHSASLRELEDLLR